MLGFVTVEKIKTNLFYIDINIEVADFQPTVSAKQYLWSQPIIICVKY